MFIINKGRENYTYTLIGNRAIKIIYLEDFLRLSNILLSFLKRVELTSI